MKFLFFLFGLLSLCLGATVIYEAGLPGGVLLHQGNLESRSSWEGSWQTKVVVYPPDGEYPVDIGYLRIVNNLDSSYSTATVKSGGVGSRSVSIEFYAPAFRGYDFDVDISADPLVSALVQL